MAEVVPPVDRAGVQYGRIDYAFLADGRPQIWEINTNPNLMRPPKTDPAPHETYRHEAAARTLEAIGALDCIPSSGDGAPVEFDPADARRAAWADRVRPPLRKYRWMAESLYRKCPLRAAAAALRPLTSLAIRSHIR